VRRVGGGAPCANSYTGCAQQVSHPITDSAERMDVRVQRERMLPSPKQTSLHEQHGGPGTAREGSFKREERVETNRGG
jgi:hypothetical protein